jgi:SAM-dependent methyltransferase
LGSQARSLGVRVARADPLVEEVRRFYEDHHDGVERARHARRYFYGTLTRVLQTRIPPGQAILDIGCGSGHLLAALRPSRAVGIDLSAPAVAAARAAYGSDVVKFVRGDGGDPEVLAALPGPYDVVLMVNVVTHLTDVQATLEAIRPLCHARTRIVIYSYSRLWQPVLRLAEMVGLKYRQPPEAWLPPEEVRNMLALADFETVRTDAQIVMPAHVPLLSDVVNRWVGHLPGLDAFSVMYGIIARPSPSPAPARAAAAPSVTVLIPCRNESGHIRELVARLPELPAGSEFLFVEGNSTDDTEAVIRQVVAEHPHRPLRLLKQPGRGKGDAVRFGFAQAKGDVVLILDSDMGVAPEDVPKFVHALVRGKGEMVNGSRMVYPMEGRAMRFLNLLANRFFARLFSWLLGQQVRDTLCGTKALYREDYERIAANRSFFGDFDPFGDFDLLFGASRLSLRIVDVAIRYHERRYGETNISRFSHGWLLLRMSAFAARKLKFI